MKSTRLLACLAVVAAFFPSQTRGRVDAAPPDRNGLITFAVLADQPTGPSFGLLADYDLFTINPDGTGLQAIRQGPQADFDPAWSPDGRKIAFSSAPTFAFAADILVLDLDSGEIVNVTNSPEMDDQSPDWSPDGDKLVFASALRPVPEALVGEQLVETGLFDHDLYVANSDGTARTRILEKSGSQIMPDWSPDGQSIVFVDGSLGDLGLLHVETGRAISLVEDSPAVAKPYWSPDGRRIVFSGGDSSIDLRGWDIWVTAVPPGRLFLKNLTERSDANELSPAWSPDGRKIVFLSDRQGTQHLYVMNADGMGVRQLTDLELQGSGLDWGPRP